MLGLLLFEFLLARYVSAATVHVSYLVDAAEFLAIDSRTDRALRFELFSTSRCVGPALRQAVVIIRAVPAPERTPPRGATKAPEPSALKLETDLAWDMPRPVFYLRVTGRGVKALGDVCQLQATEVAGGDGLHVRSCPPDSVPSGALCVDRYEESVWEIPDSRVDIISRVIAGTVTLSDLTGGGARQVGFAGPPFDHAPVGGSFRPEGRYAPPLYAASLPGILPSTFVSAYQAWAACGFSGKRLLTSAEWTAAAFGTPDATDDYASACNTGGGIVSAGAPVKTGSRSGCVSSVGAFDMAGNVAEWTMDGHLSTQYRGGSWDDGSPVMQFMNGLPDAGDTALTSRTDQASTQDNAIGFRCAR